MDQDDIFVTVFVNGKNTASDDEVQMITLVDIA